MIQWDILFIFEDALSHCLDECVRLSRLCILQGEDPKSAESIIRALTYSWLKHYGPPKYIVADGEGGLSSNAAAQWASRHNIELKIRAPRAHAWMVERHHELFRQLVHRTYDQLASEGIHISREDLYSECEFVKNAMLSVGGVAPMQAVGNKP